MIHAILQHFFSSVWNCQNQNCFENVNRVWNTCHTLLEYLKMPGQLIKWTASSEFGTYRLCEQRRFRRACASAQSRQTHRCSLIQAVSQEEHSDRKPDPWPLWIAGHEQLKFVMTECSKTQIRLTGPKWPDRECRRAPSQVTVPTSVTEAPKTWQNADLLWCT